MNQTQAKISAKFCSIKMLLIFALLNSGVTIASYKTCFRVEGMTCGKCVKKVEEAFRNRLGIQKTLVYLKKGRVVFESQEPLSQADLMKQFDELNLKSKGIPCEE